MSMVNLNKLQAIYVGNIETVIHDAEMKNGYVVNLGDRVTDNQEVFNVSVPTTATLGSEEILLVASPEVMYDEPHNISDFKIEAGKLARAYHLTPGDVWTAHKDLIDGTPIVGQYVIPQNGKMLLKPAADLTDGTRFVAKVDAETTIGYEGEKAWRLRVVKA